MEKCKLCQRERPTYIADPSCAKGGYCEWEEVAEAQVTQLNGSKVIPMDVHWGDGNGTVGNRLIWSFPNTAIVEGLEVEPRGSSYMGFIDTIRVGLSDYLHIGPYPILMWSPGMPPVQLWLPSIPISHHFTIETSHFFGRIRPRGLIVGP